MSLPGKGDFLNVRLALLASASLFVAAPALAQDAGLAADAKAFGAREAVIEPALSADGTRVIYVTPGSGRKSIAVVGNLNSGQFTQVVGSQGNPDILRWCSFASSTRVICRITGNTLKSVLNEPIGFSRLVALNHDGSNAKMLGQTDSFYDARIRQFDASVVDWLDSTGNKVLLQRDYVPEEGKIGTHLVRTKSGLGVDRVDVVSLSSENIETPREGVSDYMSDGRGNVRLMQTAGTVTPSGDMLSGQIKYLYRTPGSRDWQTLTEAKYDEFEALAVDAESNQLYALNKNGFKNWRTSIADITASTKWLAAQGIADPAKTAILGWSYGGYAALQSAATEPNLYKAVVAIAPVTDLAMLKADYHDFTNRELVEQEIGQGPHLVEGSPLRHASDIRVPVLLAHGDLDSNVRIAHSLKMEAALKGAGKDVKLMTFSGLDHQLDDSDVRSQMLFAIGEFLDRAIGP
jgi:dienelactone hydrolase